MEKILCVKTLEHLSQRFLPNDWSYPMEKISWEPFMICLLDRDSTTNPAPSHQNCTGSDVPTYACNSQTSLTISIFSWNKTIFKRQKTLRSMLHSQLMLYKYHLSWLNKTNKCVFRIYSNVWYPIAINALVPFGRGEANLAIMMRPPWQLAFFSKHFFHITFSPDIDYISVFSPSSWFTKA